MRGYVFTVDGSKYLGMRRMELRCVFSFPRELTVVASYSVIGPFWWDFVANTPNFEVYRDHGPAGHWTLSKSYGIDLCPPLRHQRHANVVLLEEASGVPHSSLRHVPQDRMDRTTCSWFVEFARFPQGWDDDDRSRMGRLLCDVEDNDTA